eukprot:gnl/TRDRNA2_/TRDRNA2_194095_c0_seq1.p1 gnl/TRDRNA2_/TRDRNA2_194095_c0~~gnl/TRDRNA2_/TRDRNA2_194095_c0_seq1.p1  ORF type:complete len:388 (+),score=88.93 gnl/TRDRNA2_/TRDRNA2_194095_c0_seq1:112-1275(+)
MSRGAEDSDDLLGLSSSDSEDDLRHAARGRGASGATDAVGTAPGSAGPEAGVTDQQQILEPSAEDLREYAISLGIDPESDGPNLMWVAREAFLAPLPPHWAEFQDSEGRVYFFNQVTEESSWAHPMDATFREIVTLVKRLSAEVPLADKDAGSTGTASAAASAKRAEAVREHLLEVHRKATVKLQDWSGPYESESGPYFFNKAHNVSTWDSPVEESERDLALQQAILCRCLLPQHMAEHGGIADGSPVQQSEQGALAATDLQGVEVPQLLLGLAAPKQGEAAPAPKSPSSTRSFATACSARSSWSTRSMTPSRMRRTGAGTPGSSARAPSPRTWQAQAWKEEEAQKQQQQQRAPQQQPRQSSASEDQEELDFTFGHSAALQLPKFGS